ncbi:MAG: hypothetical protein KAT34_04840 [Candidatus Aminicenantes bacterium]|nr:hypothetical protein [Candidatus Aminicenantes bacterium]
MYNVEVTNHYKYDLTTDTGKVIKKEEGVGLGHFAGIITVPGMGQLNFFDLGDKKLPGFDLKETWGILLRYKTIEVYNRYEGEGHIILVVNPHGEIITNARGSIELISLPEFTIDRSYPV